jgi:Lambda phage tail tube protein, TTP
MAKFTGKNCEIMVKTAGATPTYKSVGQVAEIGNIDVTADEVEVTTLDAGDYRDYIQGFKDPGECQLTVLWDPALADQNETADGLFGLFTSGETRDWVIRWNASGTGGESFGHFKGFIRDWSFGALNPDDPQEIQPTIRVVGPITLEDTMPTATADDEGAGTTAATGAAGTRHAPAGPRERVRAESEQLAA